MPFTDEEKKSFNQLLKILKIKNHTGWKNFTRNLNYPTAMVLDINDIPTLQRIVKAIYQFNLNKAPTDRITLRAAAGGIANDSDSESYSFSEGVPAEIIVRLVGDDFQKININSAGQTASLGASVKVGDADNALYNLGYALSTSSLIPYVTVSGLSANAGHGTGGDQPSFAGLIEAMTLVLENGDIVRIKNPLLNLDKTNYDEAVSASDFAVMRAAHLGLFGIVTNVEMKVVPATKLHCVMDVKTLPEVLEDIKNGLFKKYPYVNVMYVPTFQDDELTSTKFNNVVVYGFEPVAKDTPDKNYFPIYSHWKQKLLIELQEAMQMSKLLELFPQLTPCYMRYLVSRFAIGTKDSEATGPWPILHYQTAFPYNISDADYLFQVSDNSEEIVKAFTTLVNNLQEQAKDGEFPVDYAIYARYFAGTNGGLSTSTHEDGKKVCGFDIVHSPNLQGTYVFREKMKNFFLEKLKAKVHWGKYVPTEIDYKQMYGVDFDMFMSTLNKWYADHHMSLEKSMLMNTFFANILHMPKPAYLEKAQPKKSSFLFPLCKKRQIEKVLACIEGDDLHANQLRNQIHSVTQSRLSRFVDSIFHRDKKKEEKKQPALGLRL